jgi:hypothetical protein
MTKTTIKSYLIFLFTAVVFFTNGFFIFASQTEATDVTGNIDGPTSWTATNNPYIVKSQITITDGATLTISEGVIVKFESAGELIADGNIEAKGTEASPIYFTSIFDDSVVGDTNGDGVVTKPNLSDWRGVTLKSISSSSVFDYVVLKYSSYGIIAENTTVSSNSLDIDQSILFENSRGDFNGLNIFNTSPSILTLDVGSFVEISNSNIRGSYGTVVRVFGGSTLALDSVVLDTESKGGDGMKIFGDGSTLTMENASKIIDVFNGLNIESGANATISDSIISCSNDCVLGSDSNIVITNSKILGDSKEPIVEDGEEKLGITFYQSSNSGGGGDGDLDSPSGDTSGEYFLEISKSEIFGHAVGIYGMGGKITGENNNIHGNTVGAFNNETMGGLVDLRNNYWGDKSGPKNNTNNPEGLGNEVSNNIDFSPFLKFDPLVPYKNPVILIPGITGTYLIKDYGDKTEIWPDITQTVFSLRDLYLKNLALEIDGTENIEMPIKVGDIIRGVSSMGIHVFDSLI